MPEKIYVSLPVLKRILAQLGEHIKEARLRRGFSAEITAQRAGMSRVTLGKIVHYVPGSFQFAELALDWVTINIAVNVIIDDAPFISSAKNMFNTIRFLVI